MLNFAVHNVQDLPLFIFHEYIFVKYIILFSSVCNVGYYKNGTSCLICPENMVKATVGNSTNCCDENKMLVPNSDHTACGELFAKLGEQHIESLYLCF